MPKRWVRASLWLEFDDDRDNSSWNRWPRWQQQGSGKGGGKDDALVASATAGSANAGGKGGREVHPRARGTVREDPHRRRTPSSDLSPRRRRCHTCSPRRRRATAAAIEYIGKGGREGKGAKGDACGLHSGYDSSSDGEPCIYFGIAELLGYACHVAGDVPRYMWCPAL